jgi:1,4-alpha-glucan branching enzyme
MNDKNKKSTSASRSNLLEGDNGGQKVGKSDKKFEEIHFVDTQQPVWNYSLFSDEDIRNFQQGTHYRLYDFFGNKQLTVLDTQGTYFAVWAPNATFVSVTGYFNEWNKTSHPLKVRLERNQTR